jgi:hypothetical protein
MHVLTLHMIVGVFQSIKRIWLTRIQFLTSAGIIFFTIKSRLVMEPTRPGSQRMAATVVTALNLLEHESDHRPSAANEVNTAWSFHLHFTHTPSTHDT